MVRLTPAGWRTAMERRPDLAGVPLPADWAANGWPLVARRRAVGDPSDAVALGLPLPPAHGRHRLALAVPRETIAAVEPPPPLATLARVPDAWRATVAALVSLGRRSGAEPRAFGSFAFAALTGLDYVTPTSDLDVLWPLAPAVADILAALPGIEARAPGRLDGEVVDPAGRGAQWRELAGGGEVLVKSLDGVALIDAAAFLRGTAA